MKKPEIQIKKVVVFSFGYDDALGYLRIIGPLNEIGVEILRGFENNNIHLEYIHFADLIIIQRDFPKLFFDYQDIMILAKKLNKPVVLDLDDLLFDLPENHPDRKNYYYTASLLPVYQAIAEADLITVSTKNIKKTIQSINKNVVVLPNYYCDDIWKFKKDPDYKKEHEVIIGYMGSHTHELDLKMLTPVLLKILQKYKKRIKINFWGIKPEEILLSFNNVDWSIPDISNYLEFSKYFQTQECDIFIAPLIDNSFNQSKSSIKFFEYSALGVPGIYSNVSPYRDVINHNLNGMLASSLEEWEIFLDELIQNPDKRQYLAENAKLEIQKDWLLSKNAHKWKKNYQELLYDYSIKSENKLDFINILNKINIQLSTYIHEKSKQITDLSEDLLLSYSQNQDMLKTIKDKNFEISELENKINDNNQRIKDLNKIIENSILDVKKFKTDIYKKNEKILEANTLLTEIQRSKAWKLALFFRSIRVKILPPNSKRFYWVQQVYHNIRRYRDINQIRHQQDNSDKEPLISVVIPIYNRTDILIESIESILNQSFQNFELLLITDGSPEDTLKIVFDYEKKHSNIRVFHFRINSGNAVRGRNKGIKEAKGKYLAFHDSDDVADVDRLKNSLEIIEKYNADIVYGGWRALVDGTRDIGLRNGLEVYSPDCDFEMLKTICVPCQSTVMGKVDALRSVGGLKEKMRYREDHELWLRLAFNGYKFKSINMILTNLRIHENNLEIHYKENDSYWFNLLQEEYLIPRTMKPKIGYVIPGTGISGGISVICEHANRLAGKGYDVTLLAEDNLNDIPWFPNLLVDVIPLTKADKNYDILIATGWSTAYLVQELPAKRKLYFVQSDESRFFENDSNWASKALNTYKMDFEFLTMAKWIQDWLKMKFNKNAIYVPNGLNLEIIHEVEPIDKKGKKIRVLLEGPIDIPFKGMEDAFKVVEDIDCEVWCVSSSGIPKADWKCDKFFLKVPLLDMKKIYSSCDILLKMSRVESFCYPPLEMMACGGAVIIGKVTGIEEYAINNFNSIIVPQGDIKSAKEALKKLIENDSLRNQLIKNGFETIKNWSWDRSIEILEDVIRKE